MKVTYYFFDKKIYSYEDVMNLPLYIVRRLATISSYFHSEEYANEIYKVSLMDDEAYKKFNNSEHYKKLLNTHYKRTDLCDNKNETINIASLQTQSKIVSDRLSYHFGNPHGGWNIPQNMPFMKEFLNEVQKLCNLSK